MTTPMQHIFPKVMDKTVITPLTPKPSVKVEPPVEAVEPVVEDEAVKSVRRNRLQRTAGTSGRI